jgi:protein gp37
MGDTTAIGWTDATYNPWRGCDKVSPGCAHCYMFTDQRRYGRDPSVVARCSDATFYAPLRKKTWRELAPGSLVFTCSWSDWFHEDADPWRDEAWDVIRQRPDLRWQILTKRPERIADHLPADWGDGWPNVWLGVSIENRRFVHRADHLRAVPAAVRFISAEPLLGPLVPSTTSYLADGGDELDGMPYGWHTTRHFGSKWSSDPGLDLTGIDWIIFGGESGAGARKMYLLWVEDGIRAARTAGTAVFVKQLGAVAARELGVRGKGDDPNEWPEDLRVQEFPASPALA